MKHTSNHRNTHNFLAVWLEFINIEEGSGKKIKATKIDYEDDDIAISIDKFSHFTIYTFHIVRPNTLVFI